MAPIVLGLAAVLAGLGLAWVGGTGPTGAALVLSPFALLLGFWGRRLAGGGLGSPIGGLVGGAAASLAAAALATVRLRHAGATGWPTVAMLAESRELQTLAGLLPATLLFGAGIGLRRSAAAAALGGVAVALATGPVLIGLASLARVPGLVPPVPLLVLLAVLLGAARRRPPAAAEASPRVAVPPGDD
ncbi:MAG: hypothetical protein FJ206_07260 [Gemmatimonadetes bacterium]|nr:hypothetical protein [Gemmatimonadota bacterium]